MKLHYQITFWRWY